MRKHRSTAYCHDTIFTLAAITSPAIGRGRFVRGHQSGVAGLELPPLFMRGASSCNVTGVTQRGTTERVCITEGTYLPIYLLSEPEPCPRQYPLGLGG